MAKWVYSFGDGQAEGKAEMRNLLGGKGANLAEMANLGLPVPPGFTITTEVCTHYYANGKKYPGALEKQIVSDLGSVAKMKEDFIQAGVTQFGSGWCWLAVKDGKIVIMKSANGESPLVQGASPILGCDVWEHSYYIDYRNRRPDYLKAFVDHLVNWDHVAALYEKAAK